MELIRAQRIGRADLLLLFAVVAWLCWALASRLWSGHVIERDSPYLLAPLLLLVGVACGSLVAPLARRWRVPEVIALVGVATLLVPFYANAQGAVGLQLVALAGLILLTVAPGVSPGRPTLWLRGITALLLIVGVLLASRSDAALILTLLLVGLIVAVVVRGGAPGMRLVTAGSVVVLAWAAAAVVWLGSLAAWPGWLNSSLSRARHELWGDALTLWRAHPVTGAGPGSFLKSSSLAQSEPSLQMVHSLVLQVGSEVGLVGVLLGTLIMIGGIAVAARGTREVATVAIAAWTFLGVHSMIDHLWEFPAVVIMAGVVLGWARSTTADAGTGPS